MPLCVGDAARRLSSRCAGARPGHVAGTTAALPSGVQRAVDEGAACVDGGAVGGAQDRAELRSGQSDLLSTQSLDEADAFPAASRGANRQQYRRARLKESHPEPQLCVLSDYAEADE